MERKTNAPRTYEVREDMMVYFKQLSSDYRKLPPSKGFDIM